MKSIESCLHTLSVITFGHVALMAQVGVKKIADDQASHDTFLFYNISDG